VNDAPEDVIHGQLGPGEKLLWTDQPRQGFVLRAADAYLIPFSLIWGGGVIFWEVRVLASGAPWFFAIWGVPFVLFGLYIMFGRFWVDARQRAQTFYAVTSERVVIVSGLLARRVTSLSIDTLSDVSLTERGDGSGTITFGPIPPFYSWYSPWYSLGGRPGFGREAVPTFELAGEARQVYETIRGAEQAAKRHA
jgi:hypothetical protein